MLSKNYEGFTLIEILVVVAIVGILSGVLMSIIDPQRQRLRAQHAVVLANVEKMCYAMFSCSSAFPDATRCDTWAEAGIIPVDTVATPENDAYTITSAGLPGSTVTIQGQITDPRTSNVCAYSCAQDFGAGVTTNLHEVTGVGFDCALN